MGFEQNDDQRLRELHERLQQAEMVTPELMSTVIAQTGLRLHSHPAKARLRRLVDAGAMIDAALTIIELELPHWSLRRLQYEDGLWHCSLSKQLGLPIDLDGTADASHELLPLAIVCAFIEARFGTLASTAQPRSVPQVRPMQEIAVCCDNFS